MKKSILKLKGISSGSTSVIFVGIHGNEKCGIKAIEELLPSLQIEKGVVFIGYGNPKAIKRNARFTEENLNRMFKRDKDLSKKEIASYEYKRAQFLKQYLDKADALLDIHASTTPKSKPFIICEKNAKDIIKYMPFNLIVSGFDSVEPGGTDYYMNKKNKIGICVECGYLDDDKTIEKAKKAILAFLSARGHIAKSTTKNYKKTFLTISNLYKTKTNNFTLSKVFKDFESVKKDQIIGIDGTKEIKATRDGFILFAGNRSKIGDEAFLFGEYKKDPTK